MNAQPSVRHRAQQQRLGHRRAAVGDHLQAGQVGLGDARLVDQHLDDGGHEEGVGDAVLARSTASSAAGVDLGHQHGVAALAERVRPYPVPPMWNSGEATRFTLSGPIR